MNEVLNNLFYPQSILIAGASSKKGSIGYELTSCILKYGFTGKLYLVNPSSDEILGQICFKNIKDVPAIPDLAIILVPKQFAEQSIEDCLSRGIKSFILITAGFRETGNDGAAAEKRIAEKIVLAGGRVVGPNCMGIINTLESTKLNATFVAEHPEKGKSGFLSQSGALGAAVLNQLRETGIRFAHFISVGNKADISENDIIRFWSEDENIKVITLYLESFSNGKEFLEDFASGRIDKPVIVLKAGRTESGIKAASSHTGALGSSDRSVEAVLKQFGIIRVDNLNDLFNTAKGFENFPMPNGKRTAIITNAGGPAILAVDSLEKNGLVLAVLSEDTKKKLRNIVHPEGSVNNPVDLLPGGTSEIYKEAAEILLADEQVDSVVVIFVEPVMVKPMNVVSGINSIRSAKPVFTVVMPLPEFWEKYRTEHPLGRPLFRNPEDPSVIIKNMLGYKDRFRGVKRLIKSGNKNRVFSDGFLSQEEVNSLATEYSLPVIENRIVYRDQLKNITDGFPFVLKAGGKGIVHKSELKAVDLNLKNIDELTASAEKMESSLCAAGVPPEYFVLQPFIKIKHEILIGGFRDPDFGPMVMFGTGGKYVEYYKDINIKSAYLSDNDIDEMINNTVMGNLIKGVRGDDSADISVVKHLVKSTAQLLLDYDEISEIDLNPAIISEDNKFYIVDIRINTK